MPYIKQTSRVHLESGFAGPLTPGELNYMFTHIIKIYLDRHGESYQNYNNIMGALEGAKLELYRRKIAPYEDKKMQENGDVF